MFSASFLRRHPLLCLAAVLFAGIAGWIGYFLATFDLDHYRDQLAAELGNRLQVPVRLGEAHLELREAGIAFSFADLAIGSEQTATELRAPKLWLQLAWHGLLFGRLILTEVALDTPHLRIDRPPLDPAQETPPAGSFPLELLEGAHIRRIEIHRGSADFAWSQAGGEQRTLSLRGVDIEASDFGPGNISTFNVTGNLQGERDAARLACKGSVELPAAGSLREADWDLAVEGRSLDLAELSGLLPARLGIGASGEALFSLFAKGNLADGLALQAKLTGRQLQLRIERTLHQPRPFDHLQLAGTWQREGGLQRLRQLRLQLDDLRLDGDLSVQTAAGAYHIKGTLGNGALPVDTLRPWIPPSGFGQPALWQRLRPGGLLVLRHAAFAVELPAATDEPGRFSFDTLDGEARNLTWLLGQGKVALLTTMGFRLGNGEWQIHHGTGTIAGLPVAFSGTVKRQDGAPPQLAFSLSGKGAAAELARLWPDGLPPELDLAGEVKVLGQATGTPEQLVVDARLDLSALQLSYGDGLQLPTTAGAALSLRGQLTPTTLVIDRGTLNCPPLNGSLAGTVDWSGPAAIALTARVELADLTAARQQIPVLDRLQLRGGMALELSANGPLDALQTRTALELRDIVIPTRGIVADISQLNGRLVPDGQGVRSEKLTARLGKSPVILQARIADLASPRLELGVKASTIRADELIFHSDRALLRDLSGQLLIDRDGIDFTPVHVRLDGGTRATVRGSIKDFAAPRVDLDISGDYADIEEIIALWTDESATARTARKARHSASPHGAFPPVRIKASAKSGNLYGMKFTGATALIVPTAQQLLIHPLDFSVGEGYCTTQVLVDFSGKFSRLRVSGHVEDVDAYAVYNELLGRKSILRGTLRGDFHLQGEFGDSGFLPTTRGNFSVAVRDGVLRHSPILGTVFSLLNVSQLFTLQLPDVSREGVPFSLLTAEVRLDKGIFSSDDLVIDSNAMSMSYVGQFDMVRDDLDLLLVVKPLGTIDKVVSRLPIAGWILGGKERALITAQFKIGGSAENPKIEAIPITAISKGVLGIFQRTLGLPLKLVEDPAILWGGGGEKN